VIGADKVKHFVKGLEMVKDVFFEDGVELVFKAGEHGDRLVLVEAKRIEVCVPVERLQVEQLVVVEDLAHAGLHLRLIQVLIVCKNTLGQPVSVDVVPWVTRGKPVSREQT